MTAATDINDRLETVPTALGRGIVVAAGADIPAPFSAIDVVELTDAVLADRDALETLILRLHLRWVSRQPVVIRWGIKSDAWSKLETRSNDVWSVDADFLFPLERLRFLLFANNYDMRTPAIKWWFGAKAERLVQATVAGPADVLLPDGTAAWVDGGPTGPIEPVDHTVISGEEVEAGRIVPIDQSYSTSDDALADDQRTATLHPAGAARVIAPAGSGKTRTMAARLRHLLDDRGLAPEGIVAVAYNKRAAAELAGRAGVASTAVRTVHSLGWA
ncbi:MAG: DNA helicase-2/ATP-dependent DNA helicase PcrA, partial [Paracrocinitomix sp.]